MAKPISSFAQYCADMLNPFGEISIKSMFGGYGVYKDGVIIGIIGDDELFFKKTSDNEHLFNTYENHPFTYEKDGKTMTMSYQSVSEEVLNNHEQIEELITATYNASLKRKK